MINLVNWPVYYLFTFFVEAVKSDRSMEGVMVRYIIFGRFYYEKSTKNTMQYSHDTNKRHKMHTSREREWDGSHFASLNVLILNWKR